MALLDIFKRKKEPTKKEIAKREVKKPPKIKLEKKPVKPKKVEKPSEEKPSEVGPPKVSPKVKGERKIDTAYRVLKEPHITEKATDLSKENQYIFKVFPRTNKVDIKKAVSELYGVDVMSVKIIKIPKKKRRLGKIEGWRKGYKKAIVKIRKGQKIEVLPR